MDSEMTVAEHVAAIEGAETPEARVRAEQAAVAQSPNGPTDDDLANAGPPPPQDPFWTPGEDD